MTHTDPTDSGGDAVGGLESAVGTNHPEQMQFPSFDGLRALAAGSVLLTHVAFVSGINTGSRFGPYTARLDVGVAVFFLISGFLLYRPFVAARLAGRQAPDARQFLRRRFLRIYPAYWVALTFIVYVLHGSRVCTSAGDCHGPIHGPLDFVLYYSLANIYWHGYFFAPLMQAWTLSVEMSFYALLPAYASAIRHGAERWRRPLAFELGGLVAMFATAFGWRIGVLAADLHPERSSWQGELLHWLPGWLDLFAAGMLLAVVSAWATHRRSRAPLGLARPAAPWVCWALAAVTFWTVSTRLGISTDPRLAFTWAQELGIHYLYCLAALFLLLPAVFGPPRRGAIRGLLQLRALQLVGVVSYGVYLWHGIWVQKYQEWTHARPFTGFWPMLGWTLVWTLTAAVLSYVAVERPALRLKHAGVRTGRRLATDTRSPAAAR